MATSLENYAALLRKTEREDQAEEVEVRDWGAAFLFRKDRCLGHRQPIWAEMIAKKIKSSGYPANVRFGSLADISRSGFYVRYWG